MVHLGNLNFLDISLLKNKNLGKYFLKYLWREEMKGAGDRDQVQRRGANLPFFLRRLSWVFSWIFV